MYISPILVLVIVGIGLANCRLGPFGQKPGQCPPYPNVRVCRETCYTDIQCSRMKKCCRTACGGTVCLNPVTAQTINRLTQEKPGFCPNKPTGPWVCSSRCSVDSDCRRKKKCCRNRCGAFACVNPEVESDQLDNELF